MEAKQEQQRSTESEPSRKNILILIDNNMNKIHDIIHLIRLRFSTKRRSKYVINYHIDNMMDKRY